MGVEDLSNLTEGDLRENRRAADEELRRREKKGEWDDSWKDLQGRVVDREVSVNNILAHPTEEEQKRWQGMTDEERLADVNRYLDRAERKRIDHLRTVAEIDDFAQKQHINTSPPLRRWRRGG
jgi:hypothetical protein